MKQLTYKQYKRLQRYETIIAALKTILIIVFLAMVILQVCCENPTVYLEILNN